MKQLDPKKTLDAKRFIEYGESTKKSDMIPIIIDLIKKDKIKICDIGGCNGIFLNEILKESKKFKISCFNLEINEDYKNKMVNNNIQFIYGSILKNKLKDKSFDIVTFRNILHHLVADNINNTLLNQRRALDEAFRISKDGGYVLFEEEVNQIPIFSKIVYYLSKWANRFGLNWKFFDIGKVVVFFMHQNTIKKIVFDLKRKYNFRIININYKPWKFPLRWKLTLLMSNVGNVFYVIKKERPELYEK